MKNPNNEGAVVSSGNREKEPARKNLIARKPNNTSAVVNSAEIDSFWKQTLEKHPEANFLQSPKMLKLAQILGDKALVLKLGKNGYALAMVRDAKRGRYLEIACGPLLNWRNEAEVKTALAKIKAVAKGENCVFVRMRPQLPATPENLAILAQNGLKKAPMHLAAEHTVMIDLTKPEDELLSDMRRQTRYEVRRAIKLNLKVENQNTEAIFKEFHEIQAETARRQNFVPPSLKVLAAEREALNSTIYVAKTPENEPVAYGLIIREGIEADYYEAASTELNRKLPGAYALLWQAILDAKKAGFKRFNLWGIAPPGQPHHRYAGVTTFKTGFGGEVVEYVPAHDLIISHPRYLKNWIVETARKKRRHL